MPSSLSFGKSPHPLREALAVHACGQGFRPTCLKYSPQPAVALPARKETALGTPLQRTKHRGSLQIPLPARQQCTARSSLHYVCVQTLPTARKSIDACFVHEDIFASDPNLLHFSRIPITNANPGCYTYASMQICVRYRGFWEMQGIGTRDLRVS